MGTSGLLVGPLVSAILLALAFPPFNLGGVSYIALWPLLWSLTHAKKARTSTGILWLFGALHLLIFHRWLWVMQAWAPVGWIVLLWIVYSVYMGLFYGLGGLVFHKLKTRHLPLPLVFAATWTLVEWIRALGPIGNPAGSIGYSATSMPHVLQWGSLIGVYGISFIVVGLSAWLFWLLYPALSRKTYPSATTSLALAITLVVIVAGGYGMLRYQPTSGNALTVALIQGNHDQATKLNRSYWRYIRQSYVSLSQQSISLYRPDLIVWPEILTGGMNLRDHRLMSQLDSMLDGQNSTIIMGTPRYENKRFYNSAVTISEHGRGINTYDKLTLMPFGEYWPFKPILRAVGLGAWAAGSDYTPGKINHLLHTPKGRLGISICLESIYPWHARQQSSNGADVLIAMVNNAWFFDSPAAAQHLQMSRLRAVENHRYMLQTGNTGITAVISPKGSIKQAAPLDQQHIVSQIITGHHIKTIYTRLGDSIVVLCVGILILAWWRRPS